MKTIFENWKLYKIVETKEEINIEKILEENKELKNNWDYNTWDYNTWNWNGWNYNTWNRNSWNWNTWDWNTLDYNTWNWNTWNWNSWYYNTWNYNIWNRNSWNRNTWNYNTWNWNTWDWNTWNWNTWNYNAWDWNAWDWNTWYFNIDTPKTIRCFGIEIDREIWDKAYKPSWLFFNLTEWITEDNMTDEEKENNPTYKTTWWYLKKYDYKEAFKMSYDKASQEDRETVKSLPWFNSDIFYEISGIRL